MNTTVSVRYNDQKLSIFGHYYKARKATFFEPAEDETFVLLSVERDGKDVTSEMSEHWDELEELALEAFHEKDLYEREENAILSYEMNIGELK